MRRILLFLLFLVAVALVLWQLKLVQLPTSFQLPFSANREAAKAEQAQVDLFNLIVQNDAAALMGQISAGANVNMANASGQTALMYAASTKADPSIITALLKAGADVNTQSPDGWTSLMYATRDSESVTVPYLLLNAGANPSLRNNEGQSAADVAGIPVRASPLFRNLETWSTQVINPDWPLGYIVPVEGATISSRASHLPGSLRAYRNGTHEGFDFYGGVVSVGISYGTPIVAVAAGTVIRADHDYVELTQEGYDQLIAASLNSQITPPEILDKLRGRQVWIEHAGGFVSRYAHLSAIPADIVVGVQVVQGQEVGETGNSGTLEAAQGTQDGPHPHVEIWKGNETYLGKGLEPDQIWDLAAQVFGEKAVPPKANREY
ncbi:MAG: peptidoglycan DD-metalloendopeptidase family protein [Trueperaceae bacterium]|nr:peptidoglycan DD-metalloendopeptidase family protein [Trueperaceae bacterium]